MTTTKVKPKALAIPWAINSRGQPQAANDESLPRGLKCTCYCPNCKDRLIRRSGTKRRPHFAHYSKQPSESCLESSIHLAYKHALTGIEGKTYVLPLTPEPTAWGPEPWNMTATFTVATVQIEASIKISQGIERIADVLLTTTDGRRIAIEIAVSNPKEPEYTNQMLSVGVLAIEHHAHVRDPLARIPSPQEIIAGSQWIAEPYSGPLAEAKSARGAKDTLLRREMAYITLNQEVARTAALAKQQPVQAFDALCRIAPHAQGLAPSDEYQDKMDAKLSKPITAGLQYTHRHLHEQQFAQFQPAISVLRASGLARSTAITHDKWGSPLRRDTRQRVNHLALQVARLGYRQSRTRPTLFTLSFQGYRAYVDFDSTEVMRMWEEDCLPAVYAFPPPDDHWGDQSHWQH